MAKMFAEAFMRPVGGRQAGGESVMYIMSFLAWIFNSFSFSPKILFILGLIRQNLIAIVYFYRKRCKCIIIPVWKMCKKVSADTKTQLQLQLQFTTIFIFNVIIALSFAEIDEIISKVDLPKEHLPFYLRNLGFNEVKDTNNDNENSYCLRSEKSESDSDSESSLKCSQQQPKVAKTSQISQLIQNVCWGYEENCPTNKNGIASKERESTKIYSNPICPEDSKGWVKTKSEQILTFYNQADFGYIKNYRDSIKFICEPEKPEDSSLECSEYFTFCRGRNIIINFQDLLNRKKPIMYDTDVLKPGQIGGRCKLHSKLLKDNLEYMSSLQSWAPEIQHFVSLEDLTLESPFCDEIVDKPTLIMKIDATVNMYHHFCDFFNLYASLHTNFTKSYPTIFSKDVQILIWRTFPYKSNFDVAFKTFTNQPILDLNNFAGKKVCFTNVMFPLLPRMIFGLYYNTPLIWGCQNSGLFHAFSKFMLHRLGILQRAIPDINQIKITFLSRRTTYRKVLNEDLLISKLKEIQGLEVRKVEFTFETDFIEQLKLIQDTDILIGIHGAGLTHSLFLPDWAVLFELYNCEDPNCYADLARLRGLKYLTWRNEAKLKVIDKDPNLEYPQHFHKHANYKFNPTEFVKIVQEGISHVKLKAEEIIATQKK